MAAPVQHRNNLASAYYNDDGQKPLAQTLDIGPQKMLLNRERQFVDYAPVFHKQVDPYS